MEKKRKRLPKRIFLDSYIANTRKITKDLLEDYIKFGHTIVVSHTFLDIKIFQENPAWVEEQLKRRNIIIEESFTPDKLVSKPFYWISASTETPAAAMFEDAISILPNRNAIFQLACLMDEFSINKGCWTQGPDKATLLTKKDSKILGLPQKSELHLIEKAAMKTVELVLFDKYLSNFLRNQAALHMCPYYLDKNGVKKRNTKYENGTKNQ